MRKSVQICDCKRSPDQLW